ncbi:MAG: hypothetical protein U9O96_03810, partial [Candidatus Thermoplasmatota archaeon]|nr:hypothetical protein [Candidatus Thermoplasmatota archaeon]
MKSPKIGKMGAVVVTLFFLISMAMIPIFPAMSDNTTTSNNHLDTINFQEPFGDENNGVCQMYDTIYTPTEDVSLAGIQNDIGYNVDAGGNVLKSLPIYVGEPVDQSVPGRGRIGTLDPGGNDEDDWYSFSVCEGQSIQVLLSSSEDYDFELADTGATPVGHSYTADVSGTYFIHIFANEGAGTGDYTISITLVGQNDAGSGKDAGNTIGTAMSISSGSYFGYLDAYDWEDWYSFNANTGQGIKVTLECPSKTDFDVHL